MAAKEYARKRAIRERWDALSRIAASPDRVVGVDLGLSCTGLAWFDRSGAICSRAISIPLPPKACEHERNERLASLLSSVHLAVQELNPELVACEGYSYASQHLACTIGELGGGFRVGFHGPLFRPLLLVLTPLEARKIVFGRGLTSKDEVVVCLSQAYKFSAETYDECDAVVQLLAARALLLHVSNGLTFTDRKQFRLVYGALVRNFGEP